MNTNETAIDYLRRMVDALGYIDESILDRLPTPESVIGFWRMIESYGVETPEDVADAIVNGDSPKAFDSFVAEHKLDWWIER